MKTYILAALLCATLISPAQAEEVTMSRALAVVSLHEGPLDMVASWTEVPGGALELTATFSDHAANDEPMRIMMPMQDGDALAFGMPGYQEALYRFARSGQEISISVEIIEKSVASLD